MPWLFPVYGLLIAYASLYPLSGWDLPPPAQWGFLWAPWPRYVTAFDLAINVLAYLPLGVLAFGAARRRFRPGAAFALACLAGVLLSLAMEILQLFLPSRVSSSLDVLTNGAGCAIGALLAATPVGRVLSDAIVSWRQRMFLPGTEFGQILLAVWLLSQLNPAIPFFGAGNMSNPLLAAWNAQYGELLFRLPQGVGVALNACGFGLLVSVLLAPHVRPVWFALGLMLAGLALKAVAAGALLKPPLILEWLGYDTLGGTAGGLALLLACARLGRKTRIYLAAMVILAGGLMSKIAGIYEGLEATLRLFSWSHGHLLNFAGLTQALHEVWPLAALAYLVVRFKRLAQAGERD